MVGLNSARRLLSNVWFYRRIFRTGWVGYSRWPCCDWTARLIGALKQPGK